jgi:hypothetical protein
MNAVSRACSAKFQKKLKEKFQASYQIKFSLFKLFNLSRN